MKENSVITAEKKTPVMTWVGLAILFAVAVIVYVYSKTRSYNNGTYIDIYGDKADRTIATGTLDVQDVGSIETSFSTDYDMIRGIALQLTYEDDVTPDGAVHIDMYDEVSGEQVVSADFDAFKFSRFVYSPFAFDSLVKNSGNPYRLVISFSGFEGQGVSLVMLDENPFFAVITGGADDFYNIQNWTYIVLLILVFGCILGAYGRGDVSKLRIERIYAVVGIVLGMIYAVWIPVGVAPDEPDHLHTAYYVSNKLLGISDTADGYIRMREGDAVELQTSAIDRVYINDFYEGFFSKADETELVDTEYSPLNAKLYLYFLPALGLTIGRLLGLGTVCTFYIGRMFNLVFFVWAVYYGIKKIPFAKTVIFVWALIPMMLQQTSSYSYDSPIMAFCVLITSLTLRFLYSGEKVRKTELVVYIAALILLLPCKGYAFLPMVAFPLVFVARYLNEKKDKIRSYWEKNKSWLKKLTIVLGVVFFAVVIGAVFIKVRNLTRPDMINTNYISWADHTGYTLGYFLKNPNKLVCVLVETLLASGEKYFMHMLGSYLGWLEMSVSSLFLAVNMVLLIFASMRKENEEVYIGKGVRAYMWLISIAVCGLASAAMLFYWTPNTSGSILGLQGRYFLPVLPLALIACRSSHTSTKADNDKIIIVLAVFIQVLIVTSLCRNYG